MLLFLLLLFFAGVVVVVVAFADVIVVVVIVFTFDVKRSGNVFARQRGASQVLVKLLHQILRGNSPMA